MLHVVWRRAVEQLADIVVERYVEMETMSWSTLMRECGGAVSK